MDQLTTGWAYKLAISLIPVFLPLFYLLFFLGNIRSEPLQEAASTGMYLLVVLAAENISMSFDQNDLNVSTPAAKQVFFAIIAVLLWAALVFVGLNYAPLSWANAPQLGILVALSLVCAYPISRTNFRLYGLDYTAKNERKQRSIEKRVSTDPGSSANIEGKELDIHG